MNIKITFMALLGAALTGCSTTSDKSWTEKAVQTAVTQLTSTAREVDASNQFPRSVWTGYSLPFLEKQLQQSETSIKSRISSSPADSILGKLRLCNVNDWTCGFFPGTLWYAFELTGDTRLKDYAAHFTNKLYPVRKYKGTHDLGFMINCSYGNALRLSPSDTIAAVIKETADNLCTRFNPTIGCIRSWDFGTWNYPVIIDNMMNLELLFNAYHLTGDKKYYDVAVTHAMTTMHNHFRKDYTSYHVVSYNNDGSVELKGTHQGKSDESSWARGQAWGLYGYTMCYRETQKPDFLRQAINIADMIMTRVKTSDRIPYWDYDAPADKTTPRDVSAAAVTASAMLDLSTIAPEGKKYFKYAIRILKALSTPEYLANPNTNNGFILKHSVGSLPHGSEIDTPINYADYYYLEAIVKYRNLQK